VILSCALFANWLPLLVVTTFVLAPLPNALCSKYTGADDFMSDSSNGFQDLAKFITGFLVVTGLALPIALAHSRVIGNAACIMSTGGGVLIYGTIVAYTLFFAHGGDEF